MADLYIGLMSGTSLDGVDGVLVDFAPGDGQALKVVAHAHLPFDAALARELLALNTAGANELHRSALAGNALVRIYRDVVASLLASSRYTSGEVTAVGAHGQTVRHAPGQFDHIGYTIQLNNPALLAEATRIDVIADFRSRDVAAGGQGAPLVPAFHRAVFGRPDEALAVLNIGGMANLTALRADGTTVGFDCGPGNALMDHWCQTHTNQPFDRDGAWASTGVVIEPLLNQLRADPYFAAAPPKSTGRDLFHPAWLASQMSAWGAMPSSRMRAQDVQATLTELTARACADDVRQHASGARELLVCGGGAFNTNLMQRLAADLPGVRVLPTDECGLPAMQVEAAAFAWLARAFIRRESGNLSAVTGAAGPRVLGALYPAG
ncbi:anhydro-N-acetylmuramic acid kinase [soil metagenome]